VLSTLTQTSLYDGNHRRLAIVQSPNVYTKILVDVIIDPTENQIIQEFRSINLAVPVSE
jgi:hypothetical protein